MDHINVTKDEAANAYEESKDMKVFNDWGLRAIVKIGASIKDSATRIAAVTELLKALPVAF